MSSAAEIELYRAKLQVSFDELVSRIGDIAVGDRSIFPFGWRKAAKGRTVWRLLEEAIVQNLEAQTESLGLKKVIPSDSEVSVFDMSITFPDLEKEVYLNIKSAVRGAKTNKDDISKAVGLFNFFKEDPSRILFIATIQISFNDEMKVSLDKSYIMPIAWLPDIYINPSNNGNLQSSKYKDIEGAQRRSNAEFLEVLRSAHLVALGKRAAKG